MKDASNTSEEAPFGTYAGFWPRFAGSFIDWLICFFAPVLISSLPLAIGAGGGSDGPGGGRDADGVLAILVATFVIIFWISCVVGYFTYFWARGQSLGMKALRLQIVNEKTGGPPGVARALARTGLALLFAASAFLLAVLLFSDQPAGGYSSAELGGIIAAAFIFMAGVLGRLWMVLNRKSQTLQDKLSGVVVVRA